MDLNVIKENYKNFNDSQIKRIAAEEAGTLRVEVLDILKTEIRKRNLDPNLIDCVDSQTKELTQAELSEYCDILRNHSCPKCNSNKEKINATMVGRVTSIVFWTSYQKSIRIACSSCLDNMHSKAIDKSILFGWWAIPMGPIQTMRSYVFNSKMKTLNRTKTLNKLFIGFVLGNIGIIEMAKTDPKILTDFLNQVNDLD